MDASKTLRLLMPQWQGGNKQAYHLGAQLLAWLAPEQAGLLISVDVDAPSAAELPLEKGIVARSALLRQTDEAARILAREAALSLFSMPEGGMTRKKTSKRVKTKPLTMPRTRRAASLSAPTEWQMIKAKIQEEVTRQVGTNGFLFVPPKRRKRPRTPFPTTAKLSGEINV